MNIHTNYQLSTNDDVKDFIEALRGMQLTVTVDSDNNVDLRHGDIVIADFIEERINRVTSTDPHEERAAFIECSLDYHSGIDAEESIEDEITLMKLRIYRLALRDGKIVRDIPDFVAPDFGTIDSDFSDEPDVDGETIINLSSLNYTITYI